MVTKEHILAEIRRTAAANGGKALGERNFSKVTGIGRTEWFGRHWARWSDAVTEAGVTGNAFWVRRDDDEVLGKIAAFIHNLGHFPVWGELLLERQRDESFPSSRIIRRLGRQRKLAALLATYCEKHGGFNDVKAICESVSLAPDAPEKPEEVADDDSEWGFVYLFKSGRYYKLGKAVHVGQRERQFQINLPEKPSLIHQIRTDDPTGIEAYWHKRFEERRVRKDAEFFDLTPEDVRAFKRRKGFM